jgi:dienelactone hydrolase
MMPFGRRVDRARYGGNDPCAVTFVRMQGLGRLPITENLRSLRWCIDLLESRPEVRSGRIGCAGLSYGGRMTMMVSAVDQRIRVAAVSGALNLMQERLSQPHSCGSQLLPGLLKYGDYSEIGSLIAPRPCVWETGDKDPLIVPKWDELFRSRLRRAYSALGAIDNLYFDRFEGEHVWSGRIAFPLFDKVLKAG